MKTYKMKCKGLEVNGGILKNDSGIFYYKPNYTNHRIDGPSAEYTNGDKSWWVDDMLHREDGPAMECFITKRKSWWYNGKFIMKTISDVTPEQLLDFKLRIL